MLERALQIWAEMLRKRLPPVLIIESDAAWDVNLRPIMAIFNKHFTQFLQGMHANPLYMSSNTTILPYYSSSSSSHTPRSSTPRLGLHTDNRYHDSDDDSHDNTGEHDYYSRRHGRQHADGQDEAPAPPVMHDPLDPWHSDYWDLLSLGQCQDRSNTGDLFVKYPDRFAPPASAGKKYLDEPLGGEERVIQQSGGIVCTTAYAVTRRGAAKLLLRTALDLDAPVDLVMQGMIARGELAAYSVVPTIMAQWNYAAGLGMERRGANSDIQGTGGEGAAKPGETDPDERRAGAEGWREARRQKSVWTLKGHHQDAGFRDMALRVAWERIFSKEKDIPVELY